MSVRLDGSSTRSWNTFLPRLADIFLATDTVANERGRVVSEPPGAVLWGPVAIDDGASDFPADCWTLVRLPQGGAEPDRLPDGLIPT